MCSSFDAILNEVMSLDLGTTDKLGPQEIEHFLMFFYAAIEKKEVKDY